MPLFNPQEEAERKRKLKEMEDKRVRFAQQMRREGFAPEQMLLVSTDAGGVIGLSRTGDGCTAVIGPGFGSEDDFRLARFDPKQVSREEHYVQAEGMGGIFGFGKKGERGCILKVPLDGGEELQVPLIANRNNARLFTRRNPLLGEKRRRGDANVVWDLPPLDNALVERLLRVLDGILGQ